MKINFSQAFDVKPKGNEFQKILFTEKEITSVAAFLFECCSGRAVAPIFKKKNHDVIMRIAEKRDENFIQSHTIFLDFDNEQQTPQELISKVDGDIQASCAFSSYSDSQEKRKFHMFFMFENPLNKEQHKLISEFLFEQYKKISSFEDSIDACSLKCSQMCLGTHKPLSIFNNNEKIFNGAEDFFQLEAFQQWALEREEEERSLEEEKHAQKANKTAKNEVCNAYINYTMCNDYQNIPWNEFAEKWGVDGYEKGWVNYRLEHEGWLFSPDSQIPYQYVDEKYFQMPYYINRSHFSDNGSETLKHWLLQTMSLYKLLNPRCDLNRILYRVLQKIELHNLNHNKSLTSCDLISVMEEVDSYTEEDIESTYSKRLDFLRETSRPKSGIIIKKSKANRDVGYSTLLKQIKTELVLSVVSGMETPKQALAIVEQNEKTKRLGITEEWIKDFYSRTMRFNETRNSIKVGMQQKAIKDLLEENSLLSERKLLSLLKEKGISIGRSTLQRRLKDIKMTT